jgi:hypothetical protein
MPPAMKLHLPEGIAKGVIANAKAEHGFQSSIPFAIPAVRLTKGIHHVQNLDNDVDISKFLSSIDGRLGTVGSGT